MADHDDPRQQLTPDQVAQLLAIAERMQQSIDMTLASIDLARVHEAVRTHIAPSLLAAAELVAGQWERERPRMMEQFEAAFAPIAEAMAGLSDLVQVHGPRLADWALRVVPANLRHMPDAGLQDLGAWMATEVLPLAWVLDPETVQNVIAATDTESRLAAIVARQQPALEYTREQLREVNHGELDFLLAMVESAIRTLESGEPAAAQSLAGGVLDTTLRLRHPDDWRKFAYDKDRDTDGLDLADYFFVSQLWGTYQPYFDGPIPTTFNRHATVHAVSPEQFTPTNALIGVLHAASAVLLVARQRRPRSAER